MRRKWLLGVGSSSSSLLSTTFLDLPRFLLFHRVLPSCMGFRNWLFLIIVIIHHLSQPSALLRVGSSSEQSSFTTFFDLALSCPFPWVMAQTSWRRHPIYVGGENIGEPPEEGGRKSSRGAHTVHTFIGGRFGWEIALCFLTSNEAVQLYSDEKSSASQLGRIR